MSRPAGRPIRVAHVITRFIRGGAQENTLLTVQGLARDPRFDVSLVTGPGIGPEGDLIDEARGGGVEVVVVDAMRREIHPLRDWRSYRALRAEFRRLRPDVVHTHSSKAGILGRAAARAERVPNIVHTIHGLPFHRYESWWRNRLYVALERHCARYTDRIISVCDAMTHQAVAAGVAPRSKFVTIYSGMDVEPYLRGEFDRAATRRGLGLGAAEPVVGVVARISPLKGHEFILRAAPSILARHPDAKLLFVGDGHIRGPMERLAKGLGVYEPIVWAGLRDWREIPELIGAMDLLVHTSLREGLARVLPQALLSAVPVVSYDVDGAYEVVIDGETGWLVEREQIAALADAVCDALGHPEQAKRMARAGRELCRTRFSADVMVERIAAEYEALLEAGDRCKMGEKRKGREEESGLAGRTGR
jgi:glycosyltransferase involved in cell wall biosynthesis